MDFTSSTSLAAKRRGNWIAPTLVPATWIGRLSESSPDDVEIISGATVTVEGAVLGTTPLMMDNTYPAGDIPVKVTMKGYKPWTGTFSGGQPQSLDVKLRR